MYRLPPPGRAAVVVCPGPLEPIQGQHRVLQSFHVLKTYLRRDAHLVLAGPVADPGYGGALRRFVLELALPDVHFATDLDDAQLASVYRRADVVVSIARVGRSTVGLIEAMGFGVPILARGPGAVGELVGGAGIVIDDLTPVLAAEALARILSDTNLRRRLQARSRRRARHLASGDLPSRLAGEIEPAR